MIGLEHFHTRQLGHVLWDNDAQNSGLYVPKGYSFLTVGVVDSSSTRKLLHPQFAQQLNIYCYQTAFSIKRSHKMGHIKI